MIVVDAYSITNIGHTQRTRVSLAYRLEYRVSITSPAALYVGRRTTRERGRVCVGFSMFPLFFLFLDYECVRGAGGSLEL